MKKIEKDSEHAWFRASIGAFVAGGLDAQETGRFAAHRSACAHCARKLERLMALDRNLSDLFHDLQPQPGDKLNERLVTALRAAPALGFCGAGFQPAKFWRRAATGAAAAVLLGVTGYLITGVQSEEQARTALVACVEPPQATADSNSTSLAAHYRDHEADKSVEAIRTPPVKTPEEMARAYIDKIAGNRGPGGETAAAAATKAYAEAEEIYHRTDYDGRANAEPAHPNVLGKEKSQEVIPTDIMLKGDAGDHFETVSPDKASKDKNAFVNINEWNEKAEEAMTKGVTKDSISGAAMYYWATPAGDGWQGGVAGLPLIPAHSGGMRMPIENNNGHIAVTNARNGESQPTGGIAEPDPLHGPSKYGLFPLGGGAGEPGGTKFADIAKLPTQALGGTFSAGGGLGMEDVIGAGSAASKGTGGGFGGGDGTGVGAGSGNGSFGNRGGGSKVAVKPEVKKKIDIPAEYAANVTDKVCCKPECKKKIDIPSDYATVTDSVVCKPAATRKLSDDKPQFTYSDQSTTSKNEYYKPDEARRMGDEILKLKGVVLKQQQGLVIGRENAGRAKNEKSDVENELNKTKQTLAAMSKDKRIIEDDLAQQTGRIEHLLKQGVPVGQLLGDPDTGRAPQSIRDGYEPDLKADGDKPEPPAPPAPPVEKPRTYVIRNGDMEFEVDSFDSAFMAISKIVAEESGYIATTNSEKLANGKVRGAITVRVPPDHLDTLVMKLRALGELKSQRITAQDVSKVYNDTESEIRAARAMENRLLEIIKTGKGDVVDLLKAEKELAVWREKIEKFEGEIRYYNSLISLSTLVLTLGEKDIKTPTQASEQETVSAGIETEDVETAYSDALKAIADAKGRVTASDLKKYEAGQFGASIVCEVAPDAAGQLRDRLKQLGRMVRLDVERKQSTQGGTGAPTPGLKTERKDTQFTISLYNLANVAPRETVHLSLAAPDTEAAYRVVLARVSKAEGRVVTSSLNREKPEKTTGTVNFEIKEADADAVLADVRAVGETIQMTVTENPDTNNVTRSKRGFAVQLFAVAQVSARESSKIEIAATNVTDSFNKLAEAVRVAKGRVLNSQIDERDRQNVAGVLEFEVAREQIGAIDAALGAAGDTYSNNVQRAPESETSVDSKKRYLVSVFNAERLAPREVTTLGIELNDVDRAAAGIAQLANAAGGRVLESHISRDRSGRIAGKVVIDVPVGKGADAVEKVRQMGTVRMIEASRNNQVPDGALARARIDITLANADVLVPDDKNLSSTLRGSFSTSISGLLWSLQLIVVGLCFVGPWALALWLVLRAVKRRKAASKPA